MTDYLGYISTFDTLEMVNGTTKKAKNLVAQTYTVAENLYTLPNGTVVNYDGTADTVTTPGKVTQRIAVSVPTVPTSAYAFYNSLIPKLGNRGTLTKTYVTTGSQTCTAILKEVRLLEESQPGLGYLVMDVTWECETAWVQV